MFFYVFPLEIWQKSAYNQRKLAIFYVFPLKIGHFLHFGINSDADKTEVIKKNTVMCSILGSHYV